MRRAGTVNTDTQTHRQTVRDVTHDSAGSAALSNWDRGR